MGAWIVWSAIFAGIGYLVSGCSDGAWLGVAIATAIAVVLFVIDRLLQIPHWLGYLDPDLRAQRLREATREELGRDLSAAELDSPEVRGLERSWVRQALWGLTVPGWLVLIVFGWHVLILGLLVYLIYLACRRAGGVERATPAAPSAPASPPIAPGTPPSGWYYDAEAVSAKNEQMRQEAEAARDAANRAASPGGRLFDPDARQSFHAVRDDASFYRPPGMARWNPTEERE